MPPPQHLLSTRVRGFVCKSCLSKIQAPRRQQILWTARRFASDDRPQGQKGAWELPHGTIRYFEQTPDGARREIRDDEDDISLDFLRGQLKDIQDKTGRTVDNLEEEDLEKILGEAYSDSQDEDAPEGPFGGTSPGLQGYSELEDALEATAAQDQEIQAHMDLINSVDLDNISDEDRLRLREALLGSVKKDKLPAPQKTSSSESELSPVRRIETGSTKLTLPIASFPEKYHGHLRRLRDCVNGDDIGLASGRKGHRRSQPQVHGSEIATRIRNTWRAYLMCRSALVTSPQLVSHKLWTFLWDIIQEEGIDNLDRMSHIKTLGDDMQKSRAYMSQSQRLLYIEAVFVEADHASAIQAWDSMGRDSENMDSCKEYWELGTRMFCRQGMVDRAVICAQQVLQNTIDPNDFRLLLPIIGAILRSNDGSAIQRAWALYVRLRFNMGDKITMEDYDSLISMFMEANYREQALAVFKDMMLTGDPRRTDRDSMSRYITSVGRSAVLSSLRITSAELDWQDFGTVDRLPSHMNNPIFFASWMKKLIGDGQLDSAEKVYNLMQDRGIRPSSISMNGLIGAWFRKGSEKYREKAETLAWQMIHARKGVVELRDSKYRRGVLQPEIRLVLTENKPDSKPLNLVSYATIETFAILLEQYRRRQKYTLIPELFEAMKLARIKPNVDFMNQLLLTDMKAQEPMWSWKTYRSLTDERKSKGSIVQPNFETYKILWEILAVDLDPVTRPSHKFAKLENPRYVFADMMKHMRSRPGPVPNELYQTIILCFCLAKDQAGTAVALRALQHFFGNFPTQVTARAIVLQLARTAFVNEHGVHPRRFDLNGAAARKRIRAVTGALDYLKEQRALTLRQQGIDFDGLEGDAKLEESLVLLSQLLKYGYMNKPMRLENPRDASVDSQQAAMDMGVPMCVPWEIEES